MLPNTTNIPSGEDIASKVKQSMQTGAAASERVEKIKTTKTETVTSTTTVTGGGSTTTTTPVTGGETTTARVYSPSDDLLDEQARSTTKTDFSDEFNEDYDTKVQRILADKEARAKRKAERDAKKPALAKRRELLKQAAALRKQWWDGRKTLSKADRAALEEQIKALKAQADAAIKGI